MTPVRIRTCSQNVDIWALVFFSQLWPFFICLSAHKNQNIVSNKRTLKLKVTLKV